ncbi:MAG: DUF4251 domain-containing protein [Rikenellaceae bacterium]|nr:DUF4251 domain-containing protein [Rikenellaceae bacterium]
MKLNPLFIIIPLGLTTLSCTVAGNPAQSTAQTAPAQQVPVLTAQQYEAARLSAQQQNVQTQQQNQAQNIQVQQPQPQTVQAAMQAQQNYTAVPQPAAAAAAVPAVQAPAQPVTQPVAASNDYTALAQQHYPAAPHDLGPMNRVERRRLKQEQFARRIDSLVASRNFVFLPNSMQELPGGTMQFIYNQFYYVGIFPDHVEVHLPTIRGGVVQYVEILNFDTFNVRNYSCARIQCGWNVSFDLSVDDQSYVVSMVICNTTGEVGLNLLTARNSVRYIGYLTDQNPLID